MLGALLTPFRLRRDLTTLLMRIGVLLYPAGNDLSALMLNASDLLALSILRRLPGG